MSESRCSPPKDLTCLDLFGLPGSEGFGEVPTYKGLGCK